MKLDKALIEILLETNLQEFVRKLFSFLLSSFPCDGVYLYLYNEGELKLLRKVGDIPSIREDILLDIVDLSYLYEDKDTYCLPLKDKEKVIGILCIRSGNIPIEELKSILDLISKAFKNTLDFFRLKVSQTEEKVVIENISEAVAITDTEFNIKDVNTSFMEMIGFRLPIVEVLKSNLLDILKEFKKPILEKAEKVKENLLPEEITLELIKVKISPVIVDMLGEKKLKNLVFIFKYPKG